MLEVKIFTLYPDLFPGPLDIGIFKKAKDNKIWKLKVINIRDYFRGRIYKRTFIRAHNTLSKRITVKTS